MSGSPGSVSRRDIARRNSLKKKRKKKEQESGGDQQQDLGAGDERDRSRRRGRGNSAVSGKKRSALTRDGGRSRSSSSSASSSDSSSSRRQKKQRTGTGSKRSKSEEDTTSIDQISTIFEEVAATSNARTEAIEEGRLFGLKEGEFSRFPEGLLRLAQDKEEEELRELAEKLTLNAEEILGYVVQARQELLEGDITAMIGIPEFDNFVQSTYGADVMLLRLGAIIEARAYQLMTEDGMIYRAQHSLNFSSGTTKPDVIMNPFADQVAVEALYDITATKDAGHVEGRGWLTHPNVVWVNEVLYNSYTAQEASLIRSLAQKALKGLSKEGLANIKRELQEQAAKKEAAKEKEIESIVAFLNEQDSLEVDAIAAYAKKAGLDATLGRRQIIKYLYVEKGVSYQGYIPGRPKPSYDRDAAKKEKRKKRQRQKRARQTEHEKVKNNLLNKYNRRIANNQASLNAIPLTTRAKNRKPQLAMKILSTMILEKAYREGYETSLEDIVENDFVQVLLVAFIDENEQYFPGDKPLSDEAKAALIQKAIQQAASEFERDQKAFFDSMEDESETDASGSDDRAAPSPSLLTLRRGKGKGAKFEEEVFL